MIGLRVDIYKSPKELQDYLKSYKREGKSVAVVPTMGALHEGHLSLIKKARTLADLVITTIYVNPTQFAPTDDLDKYPRPFEKDCALAEELGTDIVFAPQDSVMYPEGYSTEVTCGGITTLLEGASRPGHFDGVTTIVTKLFNITLADHAVFGQKDAQQVLVMKKLVRDLNIPVKLHVALTIREEDGLAMSSRNKYLTKEERLSVPTIYKGLQLVQELYNGGERSVQILKEAVQNFYHRQSFYNLEYVSIADLECYEIEESIETGAMVSLACSTTVSHTRLIDNILLGDL